MSDALRENELIIRACILYEVLDKKSIQESYKNFCRNVGNDAMSYSDFEFWFYRFYNGNHDLHYDRSADPAPCLLSDMPSKVIEAIVNHMGIINIMVMMKVLQSFRNVIKNMEVVIDSLDVLFDEGMSWIVYNGRYVITYGQIGDGCMVSHFDRKIDKGGKFDGIFVAAEDCINICTNDLMLFFENRKVQLETVTFNFAGSETQREKYIKGILKAFESAESFSPKSVETDDLSLGELAQLLPVFHADDLEEISFHGTNTNGYEQLAGLEQWKKARKFNGFEVLNVPIECFFHFESLLVRPATFTKEDAMKIRDILLDRCIRIGEADIHLNSENISDLKTIFGADDYHIVYQTPDNRFLDVKFFPHMLYIRKVGYNVALITPWFTPRIIPLQNRRKLV